MTVERTLILVLTLSAVAMGTTTAVTRPLLYRLGDDGTPSASGATTWRGSGLNGRWLNRERPRDWSRFQGRGPGTAK
ncbi:hypothetical protein [Synechococcus sp. 1G10]|uniref:hypothetical protein n=1 Tax=Synechococcus sp. 1G10 TaxID=2025605 RepID=UPI000B99BD1C|nr:hypothetical protein [Synechococcus sp. 1G10]